MVSILGVVTYVRRRCPELRVRGLKRASVVIACRGRGAPPLL